MLTEQGHPEDGTDDEAPNQAETFVIMKPESEWHTGRKKEQIVDAMRAELEKRPGVGLQLQPADQGPRRGVDLRHPRADRRQDLRRGSAPHAREAGGGEADPRRRRAARATSRSTAPARAQHVVADIDREATARYGIPVRDVEDALESGFGGQLATSMWEGERKVGVRVKLPTPTEGDARRVGRLDVPVGNARAAAVGARQRPRRPRAHADQPRAGRPLPGAQVQHRGPRHGLASSTRRRRACAARSSCPRATT